MNRVVVFLVLTVFLAGCAGGLTRPSELTRFDYGYTVDNVNSDGSSSPVVGEKTRKISAELGQRFGVTMGSSWSRDIEVVIDSKRGDGEFSHQTTRNVTLQGNKRISGGFRTFSHTISTAVNKDNCARIRDTQKRYRVFANGELVNSVTLDIGDACVAMLSASNKEKPIVRNASKKATRSAGLSTAGAPDTEAGTREIDQRIDILQSRLEDLTVKYTDRHPDVVLTRKMLKQLEDERAQVVAPTPQHNTQEYLAAARDRVDHLRASVPNQGADLELADIKLVGLDDHTYQFEVTMFSRTDKAKPIEGEASLSVFGNTQGAPKLLDMMKLTNGRRSRLPVRFRHYQTLKSNLTIPNDFQPVAIMVVFRPASQVHSSFERSIDWTPTKP